MPEWAKDCIEPGVGSGEGLVERVCDPDTTIDQDGNIVAAGGAKDKRCLIRLGELSRCFKLNKNEKSSLSEYLRDMWDGGPVSVPNRSSNRLRASGYAVSVFGDITPAVLQKMLKTGTEGEDGWMNRFLWVRLQGGPDMPSGGSMKPLEPFLGRLKGLCEGFSKDTEAVNMSRDAEAEALWYPLYNGLRRSGDSVPNTDRARPQVAGSA